MKDSNKAKDIELKVEKVVSKEENVEKNRNKKIHSRYYNDLEREVEIKNEESIDLGKGILKVKPLSERNRESRPEETKKNDNDKKVENIEKKIKGRGQSRINASNALLGWAEEDIDSNNSKLKMLILIVTIKKYRANIQDLNDLEMRKAEKMINQMIKKVKVVIMK